jgi:pimeloyl-ACP methyl ester carboxylesterase
MGMTSVMLLLLAAAPQHDVRIPLASGESLQVHLSGPGAGDPVVMIPGLFGSAFGFRKVIPVLLRDGHGAIVVEPLAVGSSSRPAGADYSMSAQALRISAVLDSLGVRRAWVMAHSAGASIAFRLEAHRPDLVLGLLSIEGAAAESLATPGLRHAMRFAPLIRLLGGTRHIRQQVYAGLVTPSGNAAWINDTVVGAYTAGAARDLPGTLEALEQMARAREPNRLGPLLAGVACPVRLLIGTARRKGKISGSQIEQLRQALPQLAVDTVPGAGHYIHEEQPHQVAAAVARLKAGAVPSIDTVR